MQISFYTYNYKTPIFTGRKEVMEKADKFSDELVKIANRGSLSDEKVKEITRAYVPNLIIMKKTAEKGKEKDMAGIYVPDFSYGTKSKRYAIKKQTMYLRPMNRSNMRKAEYVKTLTHEMTHVFQSEDKDTSEVSLMNKFLKFKSENESNETLIATFSIWQYFEEVLLYELMDGINSTASLNNGIFPYKIGVDRANMKKSIDEIFDIAKQKFPNINIEFVKKFIKQQCKHEADAYSAGQKALRKFKKEPPSPHDNIIPKLYESISMLID